MHELGPEALLQLELLLIRAPPELWFVLVTRHDVRLGLHRLRLEGELAEIREPDLRSAAITGPVPWSRPGAPPGSINPQGARGLLSWPLSRSLAGCSGGAFMLTG